MQINLFLVILVIFAIVLGQNKVGDSCKTKSVCQDHIRSGPTCKVICVW